ncbi:MAG: YeeE/YedE family protein [Desulfobacterota bacterium]|nr:YeeE/YedE family protein [Thermodesulfobacteriota bacterium]
MRSQKTKVKSRAGGKKRMQSEKKNPYWNPYVAGMLAGCVLIGSVAVSGKFFGTSTTFVRSVGMIEKSISPDHVANLDYFKKEKPMVDWQWMFVIGIFFGASLAAKMSGTYALQLIPDMWQRRFGQSIIKRAIVAFVGGTIAMIGARLADGCPSGHGLSGGAQLSVGSLIALVCFFTGGIIMTRILFGGGTRS